MKRSEMSVGTSSRRQQPGEAEQASVPTGQDERQTAGDSGMSNIRVCDWQGANLQYDGYTFTGLPQS
jgi:hypothetical protein